MNGGHSKKYAVVEFYDGVQLIPTNWITDDKTMAYWPDFRNTNKFNKAVKNRVTWEKSWTVHLIKRIMCLTSSYDIGQEKLKAAEFLSDLNTDTEFESLRNKKKRAPTKTITYSSDEEVDNNNEKLNVLYPVPQKTSILCKQKEPGTNNVPTEHEDFIDHSNISIENQEELQSLEYNLRPSPRKINEDFINKDTADLLARKFAALDMKVEDIRNDQKQMINKMNLILQYFETNGRNQIADGHVNTSNDYSIEMENLPLQTSEILQSIETKVLNKSFANSMVNQLGKIGGEDAHNACFHILRYVFTDELASMYNWVGKGNKFSFKDLKICQIIYLAVRVRFPEATDDNIAKSIKSWLRHAKERLNKKK